MVPVPCFCNSSASFLADEGAGSMDIKKITIIALVPDTTSLRYQVDLLPVSIAAKRVVRLVPLTSRLV